MREWGEGEECWGGDVRGVGVVAVVENRRKRVVGDRFVC